jgi:hypothetical protein
VGTNARTMKTASRTLVKSPPEVWEQLDHPGRMQGLMCALVGHATEVSVTEREEESTLAWKAVPDDAWIKVEIGEKGWGTNVSVTAENGGEPTKLEGWLDAVIEELATPQKRPFEGMGEAEEPEVKAKPMDMSPMEAPKPVAAVVEEMPAETETAEPAIEESSVVPVAESPPPEPPAPEPKKKKRFGFLGF